jgi:hypothetical protein
LSDTNEPAITVRVHVTNIAGLGAVQLVKSLLPALEVCAGYRIEEIYLPGMGELAQYRRTTKGVAPIRYRRRLPNSLSRFLECTVLGYRFDGTVPLLVLGDLPIRCRTRQTVFVQTPLVAGGSSSSSARLALKYRIARLLFRLNIRRAAALIVQTPAMKTALESTYPCTRGAIHVVPQPVPQWLLDSKLHRRGRARHGTAKLTLFYPAAPYPHKNHELLAAIKPADSAAWPVELLVLTIPATANPNPGVAWLQCIGALPPARVLEFYQTSDALIFLSNAESYGFPLVEAMWCGLPIICPDLPYARTLCGDDALYFDAGDLSSLHASVIELHDRLRSGWWPDWTKRLQQVPDSWEVVARQILRIAAPTDQLRSN